MTPQLGAVFIRMGGGGGQEIAKQETLFRLQGWLCFEHSSGTAFLKPSGREQEATMTRVSLAAALSSPVLLLDCVGPGPPSMKFAHPFGGKFSGWRRRRRPREQRETGAGEVPEGGGEAPKFGVVHCSAASSVNIFEKADQRIKNFGQHGDRMGYP